MLNVSCIAVPGFGLMLITPPEGGGTPVVKV